MDLLISTLTRPYRFALRGSNKSVRLSHKQWHPGSVMDTFKVCYTIAFRFASHLGALYVFILLLVTACMFQFVGPVFL